MLAIADLPPSCFAFRLHCCGTLQLKIFQFVPHNPDGVPGLGCGGKFKPLQEFTLADMIDVLALGTSQSDSCSGFEGALLLQEIFRRRAMTKMG